MSLLSVNSENQNDDSNVILMMHGIKFSLPKNQYVDKNRNFELARNLNDFHADNKRTVETDDEKNVNKQQINQKSISRLQAMTMSGDDYYGGSLLRIVNLRYTLHSRT